MLTDEQLDKLAEKLLKKIALEPSVELKGTQIMDKHGNVHDLANLVTTRCIIDTGVSLHIAVEPIREVSYYWFSSGGSMRTSEQLADLIHEQKDNSSYVISVHEF